MADAPPNVTTSATSATASDAPRAGSNRRPPPGTPRWVKGFVIAAIILVVLFVILHLTGNGFGDHMHMHMSAIESGVLA